MTDERRIGPDGTERQIIQTSKGPVVRRRNAAVTEDQAPSDYHSAAGKKGGKAVKAKYGSDFYRKIGKKGGEATAAKTSTEELSERGRIGGKNGRGVPRMTAEEKALYRPQR